LGKGETDKIGIEQRDDHANARDTKPYRHILGPIHHQQADNVTLLKPLPERPSRISVYVVSERAVSQTFSIGEQRRSVALSRRDLRDHGRQNSIAIIRNGRS
jgi:hypothetical protein